MKKNDITVVEELAKEKTLEEMKIYCTEITRNLKRISSLNRRHLKYDVYDKEIELILKALDKLEVRVKSDLCVSIGVINQVYREKYNQSVKDL